MGIIQIVAQMMFYIADPVANPFWSPVFVQTLLFLLIGVLAYWLVFRNVVGVVPLRGTSGTLSEPPFFASSAASSDGVSPQAPQEEGDPDLLNETDE